MGSTVKRSTSPASFPSRRSKFTVLACGVFLVHPKTSLEARRNPLVFLGMEEIFGDLGEHPVFRERFSDALDSIWSDGVEKTMESYLLF